MGIWFGIQEIVFSDGTKVELRDGSVIVLVGPNNSGKSSAIAEIHRRFVQPQFRSKVTKEVPVRYQGNESDFEEWMSSRLEHKEQPNGDTALIAYGVSVGQTPPVDAWKSGVAHQYFQKQFFSVVAAGESRAHAGPAGSINFLTDIPQHPIHLLFRNSALMSRIEGPFWQAFSQHLLIDRFCGSIIPLRCGPSPMLEVGETTDSDSYISKMQKMPLLHEQGDGMRAFVGCLLAATVGEPFVVLLDEPETFLHPPQARLLGTMLAGQKAEAGQLIVATHSSDMLRGLLESDSSRLTVVRLQRDGDINRASVLDSEAIKSFWNDPVLRFSNLLDGIFHERVVVCEADGDCRFYSAVLEAIADRYGLSRDIMFTPCGGIKRVPTVVRALVQVGVPTAAIVDFDAIRDRGTVQPIVESIGGKWDQVSEDFREFQKLLGKRHPPLIAETVRTKIKEILDSASDVAISEAQAEAIEEVVKRATPWGMLKRTGLQGLDGGEMYERARSLLASLRRMGVFVVECGELERFVPGATSQKSKWLAEVLLKYNLQSAPELEAARQFVKTVAAPPKPLLSTGCPNLRQVSLTLIRAARDFAPSERRVPRCLSVDTRPGLSRRLGDRLAHACRA